MSVRSASQPARRTRQTTSRTIVLPALISPDETEWSIQCRPVLPAVQPRFRLEGWVARYRRLKRTHGYSRSSVGLRQDTDSLSTGRARGQNSRLRPRARILFSSSASSHRAEVLHPLRFSLSSLSHLSLGLEVFRTPIRDFLIQARGRASSLRRHPTEWRKLTALPWALTMIDIF